MTATALDPTRTPVHAPAGDSACRLLWRSGTGETVLVLPGPGCPYPSWRTVAGHLSSSHDVVVLDLPPLPRTRRPVSELAPLVEEQLDLLDLDLPHVLGCGVGAQVALELARRGRVRSVVAVSPCTPSLKVERSLETVECPVVLAHGGAGPLALRRVSALASVVPGARLRLLPAPDRSLLSRLPEEVARLVGEAAAAASSRTGLVGSCAPPARSVRGRALELGADVVHRHVDTLAGLSESLGRVSGNPALRHVGTVNGSVLRAGGTLCTSLLLWSSPPVPAPRPARPVRRPAQMASQ